MFDKAAAIASLSLNAADGDIVAAMAAHELEQSLRYEQLINGLDDDELATETIEH